MRRWRSSTGEFLFHFYVTGMIGLMAGVAIYTAVGAAFIVALLPPLYFIGGFLPHSGFPVLLAVQAVTLPLGLFIHVSACRLIAAKCTDPVMRFGRFWSCAVQSAFLGVCSKLLFLPDREATLVALLLFIAGTIGMVTVKRVGVVTTQP